MTENITGLMAGKTVLVTGGTSGIGKATAAGLAALGARVGSTGRDLARTRAAAADIIAAPAVDAFAADMSSQAAVRRLAREVLDAYSRLAVLVNNVSGFWATRRVTVDGLEHTFAVNHLASFLLTDVLLDRRKAGAPAADHRRTISPKTTGLKLEHIASGPRSREYRRETSVQWSKSSSC
jgi:retinol dehydrogenase 14